MKSTRSLGSRRPCRGFTLVEVSVVVVCLFAIAGLVIPTLAKRKRYSSKIHCVIKLKNLGLAARVFATDNEGLHPWQQSVTYGGTKELLVSPWHVAPHFQALSNELTSPWTLLCSEEKQRKAAAVFSTLTDANVSYFIGLDASEESPKSILSGYRQLIIDGTDAPPGRLLISSTNRLRYS